MISKVKKELNLKNKHAKEAISLAKARWYNELSTKIHDMNMNPKVAWEYIRILTGGETAHHKKTQNMAMRMENGKLAKDHKDNMKVMYPHFQRVFNNHSQSTLQFYNWLNSGPFLEISTFPSPGMSSIEQLTN